LGADLFLDHFVEDSQSQTGTDEGVVDFDHFVELYIVLVFYQAVGIDKPFKSNAEDIRQFVD
jgi:hypothetical protein